MKQGGLWSGGWITYRRFSGATLSIFWLLMAHGTPPWCRPWCRTAVLPCAVDDRKMSLESYLRAIDGSFRDQDGPSLARYLGADAADIPSSGFVSYLKEVCCCLCRVRWCNNGSLDCCCPLTEGRRNCRILAAYCALQYSRAWSTVFVDRFNLDRDTAATPS